MAKSLKSVSNETMKLAKMGGSVPKKPKKPKGKITESKFDSFADRYNDWVSKVNELAKKGREKQAEKKKAADMRAKIKKA